jgi:hypothetical protein
MHTSLLVSYQGRRVMIDCGLDWLGKLKRVNPSAIVLTHGHPDHAWGLRHGAPSPVYATQTTWQELQHYPVKDRHVIKERVPAKICAITFEAFRLALDSLSGGRLSRERRPRSNFLCARPDIYSRTWYGAKRCANLHWRWRYGNALVRSQARQSTHWSRARPNPTDMVPERERSARDHHALRIGNRRRR